MRHTRQSVALLLAGGLIVAATMSACGGSISPSPLTPTQSTITALPSDADMLADKVMGNAGAANTIVEYVSFWNQPSATFHLGTVPQIKSQFLDTGTAKLIFRNLFVTNEPPSAAELVRCAGTAKLFDAVNLLFTNQATWANANNPEASIQSYLLGFGMSQAVINACEADTTLLGGLNSIQSTALAQTYTLPDGSQRAPGSVSGVGGSILAVPALVVNGTLFDGYDASGNVNANFAPTVANIQPLLAK